MVNNALTTPQTITFPEGLIGCEEWRHFELDPSPETTPLLLLNSLDDPDLAFIIADPRLFTPDFAPRLSDADLEALGNPDPQDMAVMVIITPPKLDSLNQLDGDVQTPPTVTVNLLGPLFLNLGTGVGRQVLQSDYDAHVLVAGEARC